jgi:predicted regulator of Ras-like GTPase activity (Roadblock/LC7/MglB family)
MALDNKPALAAAAQKALSRLAQNCPGLKWATVATKDGAEVASHGSSADEKLSVMTGTMHALADGIVGEAELGSCNDIILAAARGRIVIQGLQGAASELVLAAMATPQTSLGLLLNCCSTASKEISAALEAQPA